MASVLATIFAFVAALMVYFFGAEDGWIRPVGAPEEIAVRISEEIKSSPEKWRGNHISITNGAVCVWVGNAVYGLGVHSGRHCLPNDGKLSMAGRYLILSTAKEYVIPRLRKSVHDDISARMNVKINGDPQAREKENEQRSRCAIN